MITLIAAVAKNGVIGHGNTIPWYLPDDFRHFKETTSGHAVIMGSRTWDSLPRRPLPGRTNFIISKNENNTSDDQIWCSSPEHAIQTASLMHDDIFVIGGASIYEQTIKIADRLIISEVDLAPDGDTFFPHIDIGWSVTSRESRDGFTIVIYEKA